MNVYKAKVFKSGNSLALRVPKQYAVDTGLVPGDEVTLPLVHKEQAFDADKFWAAVEKVQALNPYRDIKDPVAWQREIRRDRPVMPDGEH